MNGNLAAAGSPNLITGTVNTYTRNKLGAWLEGMPLSGSQVGGLFGSALALVDSPNGGLLVGAPNESANDTSTQKTGTAYFFSYDRTLLDWTQLGSVLTGNQEGEQFGAAVALSDVSRLVVGAPHRSSGSGGVFTFELSSSGWALVGSPEPLTISVAGGAFGTSVAITPDGTKMLAGAPNASGGNGQFSLYTWSNGTSGWVQAFTATGLTGEKMGYTVSFLNDQGDQFAASAPGAINGKAYVYQLSPISLQVQLLGQGIVGTSGESLGGSLAGFSPSTSRRLANSNSSASAAVLVGTTTGFVKNLEYNAAAQEWVQKFKSVDVGGGSAVTSLSAFAGTSNFFAGVASEEKTVFYSGVSSSAPTIAPTTRPSVVSTTKSPMGTPQPSTQGSRLVNNTQTPSVSPTVTGTALPTSTATGTPSLKPAASSSAPVTIPPTASAGTPTGTPTAFPTTVPTSQKLQWIQVGSTIKGSSANLGVSVALSRAIVAAGANLGTGAVTTLTRQNSSDYATFYDLTGNQSSDLFGNSVYLNKLDASLLVGAPGVYAIGTTTSTGAAYYYFLSVGRYVQLGPPIRGDADVYAAGEAFGYSVATSDNALVAVGAPWSSYNNVQRRGRVYTFVHSGGAWNQQTLGSVLVGANASDLLGTAVDISADGSTLVAGAPGSSSGAGAVILYKWNGSSWIEAFNVTGNSAESLGSAVQILTSDGSVFAAGGPGYNSGAGVVRVYQLQGGSYVPYGQIITGNSGDRIGGTNALSGSDSVVLTSTAGGLVRTYGYESSSGTWNEIVAALDTGLISTPAISGSDSLMSLVAGSQNSVKLYSLG